VTNLDGSAPDLDARKILATTADCIARCVRRSRRLGRRRIGSKPRAAPPHNPLFPFDDKSRVTLAVAVALADRAPNHFVS